MLFHDSEYSDARSPSIAFWRNYNLVWERVRVVCDRGNMIFPNAGRGDDLENRFL